MTTYPDKGNNQVYGDISVLLVEDSVPQALKTKLALETIGCSVYWVDNGTQGLAAALEQRFNLIVLDIELPDINGFEICKRLKANPNLAAIPVVMLTTLDQAENVMHGLDAGAVDYIPKDAFADVVLAETVKQMQLEVGQ
jgi:DNA-binding response OmpR family regulator